MYVKISWNNHNYKNKVIFMKQHFLSTLFFSRNFPLKYFKVSNLYHTLSVLQIWYIIRKTSRKFIRVILATYGLLVSQKLIPYLHATT